MGGKRRAGTLCELLIDTSRFITSRISDGSVVLVDKEIVGNLNFTRYEKE